MTFTQTEINEIYSRNYKPCTGFVISNSGNRSDADDNYQDAWIAVLSALDKGKEIDNIDGFIWGVNKFIWQGHIRKRTKGDFS